MDMYKRGYTTIAVSVKKPSSEFPKGGTFERLEKFLQFGKEPWDLAVSRLLDFWELHPELHEEFYKKMLEQKMTVKNGK